MSVAFPRTSMLANRSNTRGKGQDEHDLHDLAKASLSDNFKKFEILDFQGSLSVFDVFDSNFHITRAKCEFKPLCSTLAETPLFLCKRSRGFLPFLLARLRILSELSSLLKARIDTTSA